jgi:hypothetical protein
LDSEVVDSEDRWIVSRSGILYTLAAGGAAVREPLTEHQRKRFEEGIGLFNRGRFFDCHEVLEEVWLEFSGDRKKFLQGLIQLTVAFHHLRNGNRVGAGRLLAAALEKLALDSPERGLIDVDTLVAAVRPLRERIVSGEASEQAALPQIHWSRP